MPKIGFTDWLLGQTKRLDPVGDLARDAMKASDCPHGNAGIETWRKFLHHRGACTEALQSLEIAWLEYQQTISHPGMFSE
jgi:hypothetical protein